MVDMNFVTSRIATGAGIDSLEDAQTIADQGVTHIIDCRAELDDTQFFVQVPTVTVLWNGTEDDGSPKPVDWFKKSVDFALMALAIPHAKVYAHCAAGVNRGPSTCYAIIRSLGISPEDAETIIRAARPQVELMYKNDADTAVSSLYL